MEQIFEQYEEKLNQRGLILKGMPFIGFKDADLLWNKEDKNTDVLKKIFDNLNINSLIFSQPKEPYKSIIEYLSKNCKDKIFPQDCETRTFLHDLPVSHFFDSDIIISLLKQRKCVIIPYHGIITYGTVSLEQAYVTFSSVCFACFVKFFHDYLYNIKKKKNDQKEIFEKVVSYLEPEAYFNGNLMKGPFHDRKEINNSIKEAGKLTVEYRMVDSFFGNISYFDGSILHISQTGASLDELEGNIDPCPIDFSSCAGITASSELPAHMQIIKQTDNRAILHGHPRFCVIQSMDCDIFSDCSCYNRCHIKCPNKRSVCDVPIVSGEVGSGVNGLCNTIIPAIKEKGCVVVYGHGLFTTGKNDFNEPFNNLLKIENNCRKEYFKKVFK